MAEFAIKILPYTGSDYWIEDVLGAIKSCLMSSDVPNKPPDCGFCGYAFARVEKEI